MKKSLFILLAVGAMATLFIQCRKPAAAGTHTHDDGTVHQDHDTTTYQQESFEVTDTTTTDTSMHTHEDGTKHAH